MNQLSNWYEITGVSYCLAYMAIMKGHKFVASQNDEHMSTYIFPAIVNAALACEIALKNHISNAAGTRTYGHDLQTLFRSMAVEKQQYYMHATVCLYNANAQLQEHDARIDEKLFQRKLFENKNAFTKARYLYERIPCFDLDFLEALMFALNDLDEEYIPFLKTMYN